MSAPAVPFARPLYGPGDPRHSAPGPDVLALKRGLWRAGLFEGPASGFDEEYNQKAVTAVQKFQRQAGIQATGHVGFATWEALRLTHRDGYPAEWAFDATAIKLAEKAAAEFSTTPQQKAQHAGVDAANFWILHRDESDYDQLRPMVLGKPPFIPKLMDCSWFATLVFFAGGAPDPNGRGYSAPIEGYTGTLVSNGVQVALTSLDLLDLVFYGATTSPSPAFPLGSPTHVAVYVGGGYVASDGSQSGPEKRAVDYRAVHSARRYALV